ncbi:multidrug effflux MFS transporter [Brevibacillus sp. HB1.4B]|uniref:multidrug effflux MFS transporter n=1 Tax=unclassified Brevibacillus TaxID=2684853 RepID=UPI0003761EA8|nr:multidrug effflux MFS transporter [Brevibacillus sp. AG]ATF14068.1 Bcr/CflA family drug resistance efflux transporter [Brevibacillus brevis X23]MDC0765278.1 multidrug effflux MFS transporter [Brevibacillus sp. AG]NRS15655.1 multidrug effflux MFS transporter [Brevibacillus sp. HB1.4B]
MNNLAKELDSTSLTGNKSRRLWMAAILGSLSAFGPLSLDMYLPALPMLADDLQTSTSMTQLSLTACMLGLSIGQLFAGPISDVRGRRIPLIIGLILYAVSSFLCAVAPSIYTFVLLRFVQGLAGSAGIVIARATVRDLYSGTELTKFFALLMLINGIAPIAAPIVGGQILQFTTWHGVFVVLGLIGAIMFLVVLLALPETLPQERRSKAGIGNTLTTFGTLLKDRVFMGYAIAQGLVTAAMFAYIAGSPFVFQKIFEVSPQTFSLIFAINGVGIIIASQITGKLAGKVKETSLFIAGIIIAGVGGILLLTMILLQAGLIAVLVPLFFVVSSVGIVGATGFSLAMQNQSKAAGSASALQGLLSFISGGIVAPLVGISGEYTAVPMGIIIALSTIGAIVCYIVMVRRNSSAS